MNVKITQVPVVNLTFSMDEIEWLVAMMLNPLHGSGEWKRKRLALIDTLSEVVPS